ncbi:MAG: site-2 protease family protein [Deltaproteobacteria bacterium]|nr:site-2 protease family protein [Deltaproteobacteria bacterium]
MAMPEGEIVFNNSPTPSMPNVTNQPKRPWALHITLFVLTFLSAMWFQSIDWAIATSFKDAITSPFYHPEKLTEGLTFAVALLAILLAHEMGHFFVARYYRVNQSLPYFIPAPTLFGTLGAVILMRSQPSNRKVLLRVALAGPFAGLIIALIAAAWGLAHSNPTTALPHPNEPIAGSSLLWSWLVQIFIPKHATFINLHPVAFAAWAGLLVTALNLIPAAQLDGGHIAYALFGKRQLAISRLVVVCLLVLGIFYNHNGAGSVWLIWAVLLSLLGLRHPPVRDEYLSISPRDRFAGYLALVLFIVTFVPIPLMYSPQLPANSPAINAPINPEQLFPSKKAKPDELSSAPAEQFRL